MRVLYVTHLYPPEFTAGVEVFASTTAELLSAKGHSVRVVTTLKDIARADLSTEERPVREGGVEVLSIVNNLFARDFEETYRREGVDRIVGGELDRFQPDVVHVHHLLYLSAGILDECKRRGIPVVMTLHDFWLGCTRFGQLLHADGSRCIKVDPERCGTCLPSFSWKQSDSARRTAKLIAKVAGTTGIDLKAPLIAARRRRDALAANSAPESSWTPPTEAEASQFQRLATERLQFLVDEANRTVDRFILPARFMVDWFGDLGLDRDRMVVETTGVDWDGAAAEARVPRRASDPVRLLFLGSLVPHKGPHHLLEAFGILEPSIRERCSLRVFGPDQHQPAYTSALRPRAAALGVTLGGQLDRAEVRAEMARTDVLIVPSLWLEIRPLVMLEAYAAGARVIASDLGGMAELFDDGLPGQVVPAGDPPALSRAIATEVERAFAGPKGGPAEDAVERSPSPDFRGWPDVAASLERLYGSVASL